MDKNVATTAAVLAMCPVFVNLVQSAMADLMSGRESMMVESGRFEYHDLKTEYTITFALGSDLTQRLRKFCRELPNEFPAADAKIWERGP